MSYSSADNLLCALLACDRAACCMLQHVLDEGRRQRLRVSLSVTLWLSVFPSRPLLAKPAAPETERLAAGRLYHRLQLDGGARLKLSASLGSTLRASVFDLS